MAKTRVIIADSDIMYINSLQIKFIEEFFDKIDLEIITDEQYFNELFMTPQKIDILIVSDRFYSIELHKHNINNIFLMTEQYEEGITEDLNVEKIYKYTSIKEIFNVIISKSSTSLNDNSNVIKETQVIVVSSAVGGVGKTTISMGISACLTKNYKKVLYVNTDQLQTFHYMMENQIPITGNDIYAKLSNSNSGIYGELKYLIRNEVFNYLPPLRAPLFSLGLNTSVFRNFINGAKASKDYDYIIIDTNSNFDEDKLFWLDMADKVIIITKQSKNAVLATNLMMSNINGVNADKYICVCNDFDKDSENALILADYNIIFSVSEYIEHLNKNNSIKLGDIAEIPSLQKIAYLII